MTPPTIPKLLSVKAVAELTTVPASSWYERIARGEVEVVRSGKSIRVPEDALHRWIDQHREKADT